MVTYSMAGKPPVVPKRKYYTNEICSIENPTLGDINRRWARRSAKEKGKGEASSLAAEKQRKRQGEERTNLLLREQGKFTVVKSRSKLKGVRCFVRPWGRTAIFQVRVRGYFRDIRTRFCDQFDVGDQPRRDEWSEGRSGRIVQAGVAEVTWRFAAPSVEP